MAAPNAPALLPLHAHSLSRSPISHSCSLRHQVDTCNLEAIFGRQSKRYTKRTSSANWNDDKLTIYEKLVYKREAGIRGV